MRGVTGVVPYALLVAALVLFVGSPGCGGGGAGGGGTPAAPTAAVHFPPPVSLTNRASITVRGSTTDSAEVAEVRVEGLLATTTDGFATWSVVVPLGVGSNELGVDVTTQAGIVLPDSAKVTVRRSPVVLSNVSSVDRDTSAGLVYVHDRWEGLTRFNPTTSAWAVVSPEPAVDVSSRYEATGGAYDPSTEDYYQLYHGELVRIDVLTGARTSVTGSGPALSSGMEDVDVDGSGNAFIVGDFFGSTNEALVRVDLATGNRFEVSSSSVGTGTAFSDPRAVDVPLGGANAYVYDAGPEVLFRVNLSTGDRTVLLDASATVSITSLTPVSLVADPANSVAYLAHHGVIHELDWAGATVTPVFDRASGHEDVLGDLVGIAGAPGNRLLIADHPASSSGGWSGLTSVDRDTGVLTVHTDTAVGSGPSVSLTYLVALVVDPGRGRLDLVAKDGDLVTVVLATGARTVVSSDTVGSGPPIGSFVDSLAFDGADTVYAGGGTEIYGIHVVTGARQLVSDDVSAGTGPDFDTYGGLAWDPTTGRIVAGADVDDLLLRVDPATGDRVSFTTEVLYDLYDMDLDASRGRLYLATESFPGPHYQIDTADLATGMVTPFFDQEADPFDDLDSVEILASDPATGRLFVANTPAFLYELDAVTAVPSFLADLFDAPAGPPGSYTAGLAAAPSVGVLFVATEYGVLAVDADTGERVLVAK